MADPEITSDWNIIKGRLKQRWEILTNDDLQYTDEEQGELIARIQKRTGEPREVIEKVIRESNETKDAEIQDFVDKSIPVVDVHWAHIAAMKND